MSRKLAAELANRDCKQATLMGWVATRRDHGKIVFIDLRDRSGLAQVVFVPNGKTYQLAQQLRPEWVVSVSGEVVKRPKGMENPKIASGSVELKAEQLEILAQAKTPPFELDDTKPTGEELRLKYRYLDLRSNRMNTNLRKRAQIIQFIRQELIKQDFFEIETPMLTKSTPEGARDYLVPSRLHAGKFYALPQSPQQYKQLLMVAGIERYFQIARCFRDEDSRGDRQPEFTQLDLELSFSEEKEIMAVIEKLYIAIIMQLYPQKKITLAPFPKLTYDEVMERYGNDRPELRKDPKNPDELAFLWIYDFPMFEYHDHEKRWGAKHHPFTAPKVKDLKELEKMQEIKARQYDLVLNGQEIGGGSIRTTDPKLLAAVFGSLGHKASEVKGQFGHLFEAFSYGVPPHGGIAMGLDRLLAILQNEPSIREVIAFPKTGDGQDLTMAAPSPISPKQLKELHLKNA